jgi:hypothetical protein
MVRKVFILSSEFCLLNSFFFLSGFQLLPVGEASFRRFER